MAASSRNPVTHHTPVLLREVQQYLDPKPGETIVDGTVGAGGHSQHILERIGRSGRLIGLDRDPMMLSLAEKRLQRAENRAAAPGGARTADHLVLKPASYADLPDVLHDLGLPPVDGVLLDVGLSSDQLADEARGFAFDSTGPLDLRFDTTRGEPAWALLERIDTEALERILRTYGEERFSARLAAQLCERRKAAPIRTARDLTRAVEEALPAKVARAARKQPATRVFQALRIAVNEELDELERALNETLPAAIEPGGRLVVITFHSLEDRLVKDAFREADRWQNLTPKPVTATPAETRMNPRARSAKLRAALRTTRRPTTPP